MLDTTYIPAKNVVSRGLVKEPRKIYWIQDEDEANTICTAACKLSIA
jgi:hypothetical protein